MNLTLKNTILSVLLLLGFCASSQAELLDKIIATVNSEVITKTELNKEVDLFIKNNKGVSLPGRKTLEKQIFDNMVNTRVQLQLAKRAEIEVNTQLVDEQILHIAKEQDLSLEGFKNKIEYEGIAFIDFYEQIKKELTLELLRQRAIRNKITVTPKEIDDFLLSPVGQDQTGAEYRLGHIVLYTKESPSPDEVKKLEKQAKRLSQTIKSKQDFKKAAISYSQGANALKGGDMGWRKMGQIPTLFLPILPELREGQVHGPIRSASGFHIIKLFGKRYQKESDTEMQLQHILIKPGKMTSEKEANQILSRLRKEIVSGNKSFESLAERYSEELSTATKGGHMGWVNSKKIGPSLFLEVQKLKKDEMSRPFKTGLGWHLVKCLGKRTLDNSKEAARAKAHKIIYQRKYEETLLSWVKGIRDQVQVEIFDSEYRSA